MFDALTQKLQSLFSNFGKGKTLSENNISEAVNEVRLALLEADVNYTVATSFVQRVKEKAIGEGIVKSVSPKQQFVKIVYDELVALMGHKEAVLDLKGKPAVIMLCGLQGSGKTTHCAKLGVYLNKQKKKTLLAACDLQRPAAVEQLKKLALDGQLSIFHIENEKDPRVVAKQALKKAIDENFDVLVVDTAGRLHVDEDLMDELKDIKKLINPHEVLFVASAATGQDAVKTALEFDKKVNITGSILTMLDGDARAGAAISIKEVTQKPLKFEGTGEKLSDLQIFNPNSMADRILGMGDVINLVRKAEENFSEEESKKLEQKLKKATFNFDDYLKQMSMIKKMGSIKSLMKMMPGMSSMGDLDVPEDQFKKMEAIILSMTLQEREEKVELEISRRKRLANGSGTSIEDVNRLVKSFKQLKQFVKNMPQEGMKGTIPNMHQMKKKPGGKLWRL
ncbi:MAG: signal recognition particle protein [Chlamydiae bacterium]|nr:signal recognition particle protein [Chlamydiota bacterium]